MPTIVDLTIPIAEHFRWSVERKTRGDFAAGDLFQITHMGWAVHGFTHIDAPCHMVLGGPTTSDLDLSKVTGRATVVDLSVLAPNTPVTADLLTEAGMHIELGDLVLLKSGWDTVASYKTPEFWTTAPY